MPATPQPRRSAADDLRRRHLADIAAGWAEFRPGVNDPADPRAGQAEPQAHASRVQRRAYVLACLTVVRRLRMTQW